MPLAGLTLPAPSLYDPLAWGEGSLDPMGLAAISERLAELMIPAIRARMGWVRFTTAMAVGALATEPIADEPPADGVSTPALCFEWLATEAFVRRLGAKLPAEIPGSLKTRAAVKRGERLAAATYLNSPRVFGFHGIYKPFAIDAGVVTQQLDPARRCVELIRVWERDQELVGFADEVAGSRGGKMRRALRDEVLAALRAGSCVTSPNSQLLGDLASRLRPDEPGHLERAVLRQLVLDPLHEHRAELALLVEDEANELTERETLAAVRHRASPGLRRVVDAVLAYEELAILIDGAFRRLCAASHALGGQALTASYVAEDELLARCAREVAQRYRAAVDLVAEVMETVELEHRLGEFEFTHSPSEFFELLLRHHDAVQEDKGGKRSWFEPFRDGWVVRGPYATAERPSLDHFVHPVRVNALRRFMRDTRP